MSYDFSKFREILEEWNIPFTDIQEKQFITYYEMLVEKNKVMNLTAITEFQDVLEKHFLDSIAIARYVDLKSELSMIDLGTGAGFPGMPLKIMFPNLKMTLADSLNKRMLFLNEVIEELQLENIKTVHGRAEDLALLSEYREQYDFCVSRAVANLSSLSEYCLPFVKLGGSFVSYKSGEIEEELKAAKKAIYILGGELEQVIPFELNMQLQEQELHRSFVMIRKEKKTPKIYPRKSGTPTKKPLGT